MTDFVANFTANLLPVRRTAPMLHAIICGPPSETAKRQTAILPRNTLLKREFGNWNMVRNKKWYFSKFAPYSKRKVLIVFQFLNSFFRRVLRGKIAVWGRAWVVPSRVRELLFPKTGKQSMHIIHVGVHYVMFGILAGICGLFIPTN